MNKRRYHMTEPIATLGIACHFNVTAEPALLDYVAHLDCVKHITRYPNTTRTVTVWIDPRYDPVEAWCLIDNELMHESQEVELSDVWNKSDLK